MFRIRRFSETHREKLSESHKTHGLSKHAIYKSYSSAKSRCENICNKDYVQYGGRGILFTWKSFKDFYTEMLPSYKDGLTLERIDVNGNYCKENCRWATRKDQARNRTNNNKITFQGHTKVLSEWSEVLGISRPVLQQRLNRGWDIEIAFNKKKRTYGI